MAAKRDFTDRFLKSLKPAEKGRRPIYYDAQIPNFGIRVTDKCTDDNKGSFVLVTRFPGSENPTPRRIGDYPGMSLAKARDIARQWREDLRQGVDPKLKEAEQRRAQARLRADTFGVAFEQFEREHLSRLRTGAAVARAVRLHCFAPWGDKALTQIRRSDARDLIKTIAQTSPVSANRVRAYLSKFFGRCVEEERIEVSPIAGIKTPAKESKRDRVLSDLEIRAIWHACAAIGAFGRAFRFMLVSGQRKSEVCEAPWDEFDLGAGVWTIPASRTKNGRPHVVPLPLAAVAILEATPRMGAFAFCTNARTPLGGFSKAKARLDQKAAVIFERLARERGVASTMAPFRLHDFRRTAATNLARLGVDRIVISRILNHTDPSITAVYDKYAREPETRAALERWAGRLMAIVEGKTTASNVVDLYARGTA
jgi:integrase